MTLSGGRYLLVNETQAALYQTSLETFVGSSDQDLVEIGLLDEEEAEDFVREDQKVIRRRESRVIEESFTTSDGAKRWFRTTRVPLALKGDPQRVRRWQSGPRGRRGSVPFWSASFSPM